ncbi:MAG: peptidoglycan DD-metalloendopeptidase family protein [Coxiellaceae bacterium]|nr:MAG: peptidoglycan DD-metalloendopeptidase family protein [Coxiellaceae bacterium]
MMKTKLTKWMLWVSLLTSSSLSYADTMSQLDHIRHQIQGLKSSLSHDHSKQQQLQQQLASNETKMSQLAKTLRQTQIELKQQQQRLQQLEQQQAEYEQAINQQQDSLASQLRALYLQGHQEYLQLLLNQKDPADISRYANYYHYLNAARLMLIAQYQQNLTDLAATRAEIQQQTLKLTALKNQQQQQQAGLTKHQLERQQLLSTLSTAMHGKQQQLATLVANKAALEQVIQRLAAHTNTILAVRKPHGKFPWPTPGRIIERFGASIEQSQLKSNGVLIAAPEGQAVDAIANGQVVFSNWMAGYGLLLIVDHGDGYMTIYGHNQSLFKRVGERVKQGELIATVGNTGGNTNSALYFAIRDHGQPINPEKVCG